VDVLVDGNSLVENETGQDIVGHRGDGEISRLRVGVVCGDDGNFGSVVTRDRERDAVIPAVTWTWNWPVKGQRSPAWVTRCRHPSRRSTPRQCRQRQLPPVPA